MIQGFEQINQYTLNKIPFFFLINFDKTEIIIKTLEELENYNEIAIQTPSYKNFNEKSISKKVELQKFPISLEEYTESFDNVLKNIQFGNSYLTNLTCETPIKSNLSLEEIFYKSKAKYKLLLKDKFVCFSPESFIKIEDNRISTFPMKGTIDASLPNAEQLVLEDEKEKAEHFTIVDLLRNDLSMIANEVEVKRFRYIDELQTNSGKILQVSSEIQGKILPEFQTKLGTILEKILPAGSISGAPKEKTIEIINESETHKRGFYTGIFGIFDGKTVDTSVTIRYIEERNEELFYKSGGGITHLSKAKEEYNEILQKVYVPIS